MTRTNKTAARIAEIVIRESRSGWSLTIRREGSSRFDCRVDYIATETEAVAESVALYGMEPTDRRYEDGHWASDRLAA